ncbi:MAG: hypothetical protein GY908_13565 [Flavobacteriales bacterium]|nr:hypothetical protein [Flavobacteriales bacterium]
MLLTNYAKNTNWYYPYIDEIFTGIGVNELDVDVNDLLETSLDQALIFSVKYCDRAYNKLLETNNKRDISIYMTALKVGAYNPEFVISHIFKKEPEYFIKRPVLLLIMFSRDNIANYKIIQQMYDEWCVPEGL